jgi:hypothetical protein
MWLVFCLALFQTVTFAIASRARNRDHYTYAFCATLIGNMAWFICFRQMDIDTWNMDLLLPYSLGAAIGGAIGMKVSMILEKLFYASADAHLHTGGK